MSDHWLELETFDVSDIAPGVRLFDLRAPGGDALPAFDAGAHVDVVTDDTQIRQYSLCNDPRERHRYLLAVALAEDSRGGSRFLHERIQRGAALRVGAPRNLFPLSVGDDHSVLVAGGIGITPLWSMVQSLEAAGRSWELHYAARSPDRAALLDRIQTLAAGSRRGTLHCYFSRHAQGRRIDIPALLAAASPQAHFYCCAGPSMMDAFQNAANGQGIAGERVHVERFAATQEAATDGGFEVVLARSGTRLRVAPGQTVLDALAAAGVATRSTCREGICGDCETAVIDGTPDHRDEVLSESERASNKTMMICCSGCRGERLVLDL